MKNKKSITLSKIFFAYCFSFRIKENCFIPKTVCFNFIYLIFILFHLMWCVCLFVCFQVCVLHVRMYIHQCIKLHLHTPTHTHTHKHTDTQYRSSMNLRCVSSVDVHFFWYTVSHWEVGFLR